ncbi:MAG: DNA topoisomerase 4 subunit A [Alphaproteobacteria bacterium MarineAlpha5_Bin9]|nr:MAG: DNA topoisomerase 4 subunit A [Alphaproteobacteria bacterium MarineAlpha5_Bin9]|tara:strand:+ start:2824 stop:5007 length:2184 start_codon:yes stop_codon:yes gene_type:complete
MNNLINQNLNEILSEKYLSYAISTIISRSLPDVRDGFKPVHRRILYSMYQLKLTNESSFKKSARIVGDVMGKFHPHGDQAIYDSLVRLAQQFSSRAPLIEGQGNFGNIDGDNAAAMRYTEARLNLISNYFFDGIEENSVDFKENYDGQNYEPVVLPTKLPNILLNGATGIAVGMATNIPPHNLLELNNCLIKLIKNPSIGLTDLLKDIKGPDFPTGGEIILSNKEKKIIYKTGKGSFIIRSKWKKETLKNGIYNIVINEIPYQTNKAKLIEQIANLINNKKVPLDDIIDESDDNIRIVLKPKNRNINSNKLMELCFKLSDLSSKFSCNFNVLENGINPKQLGLKEILKNFLDYRKITIKRKSIFNKERITKRLEILKGYLIAYKYLNQIIKIIRTNNDPKSIIIKKYKLTKIQTEAILSMRLGSLKKIDEKSTNEEITKLKKELNFLNSLINKKNILDKFIINELKTINIEMDNKDLNRKTNIISNQNIDLEVNIDEFKQIEKLTVIIDKDNNLKTVREHLEKNKYNKEFRYINILSNQKILLFSSSGRVYTIDPNKLPSGKSNAKNFMFFIESKDNELLINIFPYEENVKYILISKYGKGFIVNSNEMVTTQKKGKLIFKLKSNDLLLKVSRLLHDYIALVSSNSKLLIIKSEELPILSKGRGVQLQKIKLSDKIIDFTTFNANEGLTWKFNKSYVVEKNFKFWLGKRSQVGKKIPKKFNKNLRFS